MRIGVLVILLLTLSSTKLLAEDNIYDFDNTTYSTRTENFYDSLESLSTRGKFSKFLYNSVFIPKRGKIKNIYNERLDLSIYNGSEIENIYIHRSNVVEDSLANENWLANTANKLHYLTRENKIRQDLFFTQGSEVNSELLVYNEQYLQSQPYVSRARMKLTPSSADTMKVDLEVYTRDSWTIGGDISLSNKKNSSIEIYEKNFLGTGNRLSVTTNFNLNQMSYGGNELEFTMPNIFGSFYNIDIWGGQNFESNLYGGEISKPLLHISDYALRGSVYGKTENYYNLPEDTRTLIRHQNFNLSGGKSFYLPESKNSIYLLAGAEHRIYSLRDSVSVSLNPAFHDSSKALVAVGIYRESFDATNLIYGFGQREYISKGYKIELLSGYRHGEFYDDIYMGCKLMHGSYLPFGYLMARAEVGIYYDPQMTLWRQGTLNTELRYFSNILTVGACRLRQFVNINYVRGWNRLKGCNEYVSLESESIRAMDVYDYGQHRLLINTETVLFTPYSPLGFRIAVFGFADFGIIGNNVNLKDNNKYTTFGVGIRVKNEKLVFSRLEFRVGFSVGNHGWINNDIFHLSNNYDLEQYRFVPKEISTVSYQ